MVRLIEVAETCSSESCCRNVARGYTVAEDGLDTTALDPGWEQVDGKIVRACVRARELAFSAGQGDEGVH